MRIRFGGTIDAAAPGPRLPLFGATPQKMLAPPEAEGNAGVTVTLISVFGAVLSWRETYSSVLAMTDPPYMRRVGLAGSLYQKKLPARGRGAFSGKVDCSSSCRCLPALPSDRAGSAAARRSGRGRGS